MHINRIENISFQRRLTNNEAKEARKLHPEIQKILGHDGHNILILHDPCLPYNSGKDTGIGYLFSKEGLKFIDDMKTLLGITNIEVHPQGEYYIVPKNGFCCPYTATALSLGSHLIPPAELVKAKYGALLNAEEVKSIVNSNTTPNKDTILNWENIIKFESTNENVLKKAYGRFKKISNDTPLKKDYFEFVKSNNDWLEPIAVYQRLLLKYKKTLQHWSDLDKNLYNPDFASPQKESRLKQLLEENRDDIDFYRFKQYFADKFLKESKNELKKMGLKLTGDELIGFSEAEMFAFPKAFMQGKSIGWGLPALDYDTILNPDSPAAKLLKRKTELFAKRYDGAIRFDVGWAYLNPTITNKDTKNVEHRALNTDAILNMIEDTVKKTTGKDFDNKNLLYEFEAAPEDFPLNTQNRNFIKNRTKVYSMQYMDKSWGYLDSFIRNQRFSPEYLVAGLGNHDVLPVRQFAGIKEVDFSKLNREETIKLLSETFGGDIKKLDKPDNYNYYLNLYRTLTEKKRVQAQILSSKYNIPVDTLLTNPAEFVKAKAAEAFCGKNTMFYFMDVLGRSKTFDAGELNGYENYRYRITPDYMEEYTKAVSEGFGINMFDIYEKRFKALGLDIKYPKLYKQIQKYKQIIQSPEPAAKKASKYLAIIGLPLLITGIAALGIIYNKKQPANKQAAIID